MLRSAFHSSSGSSSHSQSKHVASEGAAEAARVGQQASSKTARAATGMADRQQARNDAAGQIIGRLGHATSRWSSGGRRHRGNPPHNGGSAIPVIPTLPCQQRDYNYKRELARDSCTQFSSSAGICQHRRRFAAALRSCVHCVICCHCPSAASFQSVTALLASETDRMLPLTDQLTRHTATPKS